jgi:hypothetical protein
MLCYSDGEIFSGNMMLEKEGFRCQVSALPPARKTAGQIEKETNERRTSNIERPTSNTVFCHFIKRLSKADLPFGNMRFA